MTDNITSLAQNEVFVFGSNLAGRHGAGAAKAAMKWGARYGQGMGRMGQTYGIPTKDENIRTLPLTIIRGYVSEFLLHAAANPQDKFLVTPIGCGLAGYGYHQIGPMFQGAPSNVVLPPQFQFYITPEKP